MRTRIILMAIAATMALAPAVQALPTDPGLPDAPGDLGGKVAPEDPPEKAQEVIDDVLNEEPDKGDPGGDDGSGGWWDWEDVSRVGGRLGEALTSGWGLLAIAMGAIGSGGAYFYMGTRLTTPEEVLENDTRQGIYAYVKETTGAHLHQISEDLDLSTTNAVWHLRKLEDAGLVKSKKFNGYRIFYPVEGGIEAQKLSIGVKVLDNDNARRIFEHLAQSPGQHQRQIARNLDINHGTVRWHLRKMRSAEMVVETKKGNATKYFPTDLGRSALAELTGQPVADPEPAEAPTPDPATGGVPTA